MLDFPVMFFSLSLMFEKFHRKCRIKQQQTSTRAAVIAGFTGK